MLIDAARGRHLTYCTNIHPANGWPAVLEGLKRHALPLKRQLAGAEPFGLGLRLSAEESLTLLEGDTLARFQDFLAAEGLYVFTLNGFPYGPFHRTTVKEQVFAPDWRTPERLAYSLRLVHILRTLLPEGSEGSISTVPLSYKGWCHLDDGDSGVQMSANLAIVAAALVRVHEATGKRIHLDLEPEPDGLLENADEVAQFFQFHLLPVGGAVLATELGVSLDRAQELLLEYIQVCYDACHLAVQGEQAHMAIARWARLGIRVGKLQVSNALKVALPLGAAARAELADRLRPFAESTYLHQVIEHGPDGWRHRYRDLSGALPQLGQAKGNEWRIHFHVPLFLGQYGQLGSTRDELLETFACLQALDFTRLLEIETYTWEVLPDGLKGDLNETLVREYQWTMQTLRAAGLPLAQ